MAFTTPVFFGYRVDSNLSDVIDKNQALSNVLLDINDLQVIRGVASGITTEEARQGVVTDADDGSNINLFTQDLRALKYRAFFDLDLNFPEAFGLIKTAA